MRHASLAEALDVVNQTGACCDTKLCRHCMPHGAALKRLPLMQTNQKHKAAHKFKNRAPLHCLFSSSFSGGQLVLVFGRHDTLVQRGDFPGAEPQEPDDTGYIMSDAERSARAHSHLAACT